MCYKKEYRKIHMLLKKQNVWGMIWRKIKQRNNNSRGGDWRVFFHITEPHGNCSQ